MLPCPCGGKLIPAISPQTLISLFNSSVKSVPFIHQLHAQIIINGHHRGVLFGSNLANAYIEFGSFHYASKSFDQIRHKNARSWNTVISGYSKQQLWPNVLSVYNQMRSRTRTVDSFNLVFVINAFLGLSDLRGGRSVHSLVVESGFEGDAFVVPALLKMYAQLGCIDDAEKVFDVCPERNLVVYGLMLDSFLKFSREFKVFELFSMTRRAGSELDAFMFVTLVRACGNVSAGREGGAFHALCLKLNLIDSSVYLRTALVEMYLISGLFDLGLKLFKEIREKDVVLWTAMIAGFAKSSLGSKAIVFFRRMLEETVIPNSVTLASVVLACSQVGSLRLGKSVHGYMLRNGIEFDVVNYTCFIEMYAKCGCIIAANRVFDLTPNKNSFCWSVMINAFGSHGLYSEAVSAFDQMLSENQAPNLVTFVSVLSACSHSGRVEEGWKYFRLMSKEYGIAPKEEHYACMIDLLGRAGKVEEALSFIICMPMDPGASAWGALLSACRIHRLVELAEVVSKKLLPLETDKSSVYVLLSNIYADAGMWDMVKKVRSEIGERGFHKNAGFTSIEVDNMLYVFDSNDRLESKSMQAIGVWISLCRQMMELVYVPDMSFELDDDMKVGITWRKLENLM